MQSNLRKGVNILIIDLDEITNLRKEQVEPLEKEENLEIVNKYYFLYEYTNKVTLISDNPQYPSMLNYVKTGILTEEEMIEALLKE